MLRFHGAAEGAGYPAMLIVSLLGLVIAVSGVLVVAATGAVWAVGLAVLGMLVAVIMLASAIEAAMSFDETAGDSEAARVGVAQAAPTPPDEVRTDPVRTLSGS